MIAGRVPFEGKTVGDVMFGIQNKPHQSLNAAVPAVSAALSAVVDRCLAKKPEARYADAAALALALSRLATVQTEPERPAVTRLVLPQRLLSIPKPVLGGAAAGMLLALGLLGWALTSWGKADPLHSEAAPRVEEAPMRAPAPAPPPVAAVPVAAPAPAAATPAAPAKKVSRKKPAPARKPAAVNAFEERR
jgi:serine/threonine-protein kinase